MDINVCEFNKIKYIICYPDNFDECKKYPLLIKFHGAGGIGEDITPLLEKSDFLKVAKNFQDFRLLLLRPCAMKTPGLICGNN